MPADTFVYFQLLDENGMMIQSMRSGASVHRASGRPAWAATTSGAPRRPRRPGLAAGLAPRRRARCSRLVRPAREFSFMAEVQPVFTGIASRCHDYGKPAGKKLNLAPDRTLTFNTAYTELWRKGYVTCVGGRAGRDPAGLLLGLAREPADPGAPRVPRCPSTRTSSSRAEELDRIITWVDLNGVYYPTYCLGLSRQPDRPGAVGRRRAGRLERVDRLAFGRSGASTRIPGRK